MKVVPVNLKIIKSIIILPAQVRKAKDCMEEKFRGFTKKVRIISSFVHYFSKARKSRIFHPTKLSSIRCFKKKIQSNSTWGLRTPNFRWISFKLHIHRVVCNFNWHFAPKKSIFSISCRSPSAHFRSGLSKTQGKSSSIGAAASEICKIGKIKVD